MRRLHIEDAEVTRIAIRHGISRGGECRDGRGLHGLPLAAGHSCRQVAELFGEEDTTVQR